MKNEINYHVVYINHVVNSKIQIERVKFNYFVAELEIIERYQIVLWFDAKWPILKGN